MIVVLTENKRVREVVRALCPEAKTLTSVVDLLKLEPSSIEGLIVALNGHTLAVYQELRGSNFLQFPVVLTPDTMTGYDYSLDTLDVSSCCVAPLDADHTQFSSTLQLALNNMKVVRRTKSLNSLL
jgi:hypothetical protein